MALVGSTLVALGHAQSTTRVSVSSLGAQANGNSLFAAISGDGRYVAFASDATNLAAGFVNGNGDIFVKDVQTGLTSIVSTASNGVYGNDGSYQPCLSADGHHVGFTSFATNLVSGDTNGVEDVFARDLTTGVTTRVSVASGGAQANGSSSAPTISADGRFVAFFSNASNLVAGDTNSASDVFVHDRQSGITSRVSLDSAGAQGDGQSAVPTISSDGRYVAFRSHSTNFVANDLNNEPDNFVHDTVTGTTMLVSADPNGAPGNGGSWDRPVISPDGRYVAFSSSASNLVGGDVNGADDVFVRDVQTGLVTRVSVDSTGAEGNAESAQGLVSAGGRYVTFSSLATNLVPGDTNAASDCFVHDTLTGLTTRVNVSAAGVQAATSPVGSMAWSVSDDGRFVVLHSDATDLVGGDTNGKFDVFVRDRECSAPSVYCTAKTNSLGCLPTIATSGTPSMTAGSGFTISVAQVLSNKSGLFFYGVSGQQGAAFQGGTLCVRLPVTRTPIQLSGGNPPPNDCSGGFSIDFNAWIAVGGDPLLVTGTTVDVQCWARDPGFAAPNNTSLSAAVHFGICH
ncbi:MAG: PD40 domain-containing protein [Planctomycetes bacterium]|nr:PD40 domain-containing protein [Planctomycetota bacterium]